MGKDPIKSMEKLKKKLLKLERKLNKSRSTHSRSRSPVRRTKTRSRSRTRSRSVLRSVEPEIYQPSQENDTIDQFLIGDNTDNKENSKQIVDLTSEETAASTEDVVDSSILELLGSFPQENNYDPELLASIAARWEPIIKKGLDKDERKELLKKYPPPGNLKVLNAPKLNPEAQAAAGENVLKRDKAIELKQSQVSCAISALGLALNSLCKSTESDKDSIKVISDAARLLCDYVHTESVTRKKFILTGLNKATREGIRETSIDEWLFGSDFSEKLKASKAIKRSVQDLRGSSSQSMSKNILNNRLNSKGSTNNYFKPKTQKSYQMRPPANQYPNQPKTSQPVNTHQTSYRSRQQNQHRRR